MKKRKESGIDVVAPSRDTGTKTVKKHNLEVPETKELVLSDIGYPFRMKGDPKPAGLEVDNEELFADYAKEQWTGTVVRKDMYLFDRYIIPDFAFQVLHADPPESIVTRKTKIILKSNKTDSAIPGRIIGLGDVIGHETVKQKCRIILSYLADPSRFGEWAPRAILFHGAPGTGKTLTARALAHEADASIMISKASDLIGTHVGDGGRRISSLFEEARKKAPCIVFIDELDAIGLARSFQSIRGDVSEVVTALLGELDQSDEDSGVVVIGATNALPLIDAAIKSRFDSAFVFQLPNAEERLEILKMYTKRLPLPINFDLHSLINLTDGFSGRDLRDKVLKEALHQTISEDATEISFETVTNIIKGLEKRKSPAYMV
ncbi:MAG: AAA family ATPase [Candidatus Thorarchaeota archaeon]|nr:AAA family ATPase [Candidatus Thorarchaeota archaeon]